MKWNRKCGGEDRTVTNEMVKSRREVVRHITHTLVVTLSCPEHCSIWKHFVPGMPNKPASTVFSLCHSTYCVANKEYNYLKWLSPDYVEGYLSTVRMKLVII
jgi:hypothetical protein